jgi:hypothetical protein
MAYALTGQAGFAQMNNFKFHHRGTEDAEILIFMNGFDYIMFKSDRIYQSSLPLRPGTQDYQDKLLCKLSAWGRQIFKDVEKLISSLVDKFIS